jgi:hypothetical protein
MPGEKTSGFFLHRKAKYLLELGAFLFVLLVSNHANAFYINSDSKVVIISGYSPDLTKQELTPIHNRLDFILQGLPVGLKNVYDASVEYLSERNLIRRLAFRQLPTGDAKGIRTLFEREKYTHLIVADVEMRDANAGSAFIHVARLSEDGSVTEWDETQERYLSVAQTDPEMNNLRQTILLDLLKFRAPDAPKRAFDNGHNEMCIHPVRRYDRWNHSTCVWRPARLDRF